VQDGGAALRVVLHVLVASADHELHCHYGEQHETDDRVVAAQLQYSVILALATKSVWRSGMVCEAYDVTAPSHPDAQPCRCDKHNVSQHLHHRVRGDAQVVRPREHAD
jgi:hypothetical protein